MKNIILIGIYASLVIVFSLYSGCSDNTVTPTPTPIVDTSQANFNNIVISGSSILSNITYSAVDLYSGKEVTDSNRNKDVNLITYISDTAYHFLATGDLVDNLKLLIPGFETRFRLIFTDYRQAAFDSLTRVPIDTLSAGYFTDDRTQLLGYPLLGHPVYGFYLKGKYENHLTPKQVFGLIYIDSTYFVSGGFKMKIDVKINKNAANNFKSQ